jgi:carbon monoxide dehydrogenase subunit G
LEFDNSFEVAAPMDRTWEILKDIERIAPCLPGAELTEVINEDNYRGNVSVRLGPVALTFQGQVTFLERDNAGYTAKVKAQGADARGRGGANADVTFGLTEGDGGTIVNIHTNLQLSGSVAQYGRGVGMITDLSAQMIGQFAKRLHEEIALEETASPDEARPIAPAQPVAVGGMAFRVLWNALVRSIKRLFGGAG